ncbi:hypothetical protein QJQ45_030223 [Haematococcus lacustris]|nr:hypothetical protein QJQ45_030223 [Haematococcus lacustris]
MLPSVRLLNPSSPRRPVISPQMALHVTQRPATKQEKTDKADTILAETVVDYAKLHQIKLNKNYGEARIWADISHLSQKKLRAENLLNDDDEGRQFTDKQCKVLWQKLVESWRKINDYITNKRTGGGPPFFELPDDERKQMANLTGKYKNMKEDLFTIMSPAMANDSASLPACLVSGGVCTEVTKRGRGSTMRAYCSDDDEDQETREARQWDDYRKSGHWPRNSLFDTVFEPLHVILPPLGSTSHNGVASRLGPLLSIVLHCLDDLISFAMSFSICLYACRNRRHFRAEQPMLPSDWQLANTYQASTGRCVLMRVAYGGAWLF